MRVKRTLLYLMSLALGLNAAAQMNIGSSSAPNASAMLQVTSTNKGFLPPQVALSNLTDVSTISSPATGLLVYCTGAGGLTAGYYYYNGSTWVAIANGTTPWSTAGNSGTNSSKNFIGTTDNHPLLVKTNGVTKLYVDSATDYVGVNNPAPQSMIDVIGTKAHNNTTMNITDSVNDYIQLQMTNTSTGTGSQAGFTASANNSTNSTGYCWMGINGQNFNNPQPWNIGGGDDVSFMGAGNNMYIANMSTSKPIIFATGQAASPYYTERMRITNAGYVGIGTTAPTYPLQVAATASASVNFYGYLNATDPTGVIYGNSGNNPFSIYAAGRIACTEFDAFSDRRIKEHINTLDIDSASDAIARLRTVAYEYIDKPAKGAQRKTGFISQEVEGVLPSAVSKSTEFIPNIFTMVTDGSSVVYCHTEDITAGDEVRILTSTGEKIVRVAAVSGRQGELSIAHGPDAAPDVSPAHLTLDWGIEKPEQKYFVYGTRVNDLRTVDFDQLTTLCVAAIQKLQQENQRLKTQADAMQKKVDNSEMDLLARLSKMSRKERKRLIHELR